jgi:hypothetical protein
MGDESSTSGASAVGDTSGQETANAVNHRLTRTADQRLKAPVAGNSNICSISATKCGIPATLPDDDHVATCWVLV